MHPVLDLQAVGPDAKHLWVFRVTVAVMAQHWLPSCTSSLGPAGSGHHEDLFVREVHTNRNCQV
jgi:hypothetical protein